ncbi:hypothetical protein BT93_E0092 [Corymbia citriodora subsp. variegata]|nr:hypothetical protein BT93_E0092 [Corymbia citriodora subsp. variegata]
MPYKTTNIHVNHFQPKLHNKALDLLAAINVDLILHVINQSDLLVHVLYAEETLFIRIMVGTCRKNFQQDNSIHDVAEDLCIYIQKPVCTHRRQPHVAQKVNLLEVQSTHRTCISVNS